MMKTSVKVAYLSKAYLSPITSSKRLRTITRELVNSQSIRLFKERMML